MTSIFALLRRIVTGTVLGTALGGRTRMRGVDVGHRARMPDATRASGPGDEYRAHARRSATGAEEP